jgi:DNA invertase Pin-like site-specific DNA recombinase
MKVVGYIRVSTEEQSREGISLDAQRARLASYAALYELDLVEVIPDVAISAKTMDRAGLRRAMEMMDTKKVGGLVVVKLDRLTRSLADWQTLIERYFLERRGMKLFSVNEQIDTRTATGRMVLNLIVMIAQWEREVIGERTTEALHYKSGQGERVGTIPYGFNLGDDGKTLVRNEAEQDWIELMRNWRRVGYTQRQIADLLSHECVPTKQGRGAWRHSAVARILNRGE